MPRVKVEVKVEIPATVPNGVRQTVRFAVNATGKESPLPGQCPLVFDDIRTHANSPARSGQRTWTRVLAECRARSSDSLAIALHAAFGHIGGRGRTIGRQG